VPTGVKIVSVYVIIQFGLCFLLGLLFVGLIFGEGFFTRQVSILGKFVLIVGFFLLIIGGIGITIAVFLWKGKEWARIVTICLSLLSLIGIIYDLFSVVLVDAFADHSTEFPITKDCLSSIFGMIINSAIMLYLSSRRVKEAFSNRWDYEDDFEMKAIEVEPMECEIVEEENEELTCPNCEKDFEISVMECALADIVCPFCGCEGDVE